MCSPTMRSGPSGRRTSLRSIFWPSRVAASAISLVPMEPKSLPSVPALAWIVSLNSFSAAARRLGAGEVLVRQALELRPARLEARHVVRGGQRGLAAGQQEVAPVAGLHLHAIADVAEVGNLLEQNDFHLDNP